MAKWTPLIALWLAVPLQAADAIPESRLEKGSVRFKVIGDQKAVPEMYRLADHEFSWEMEPKLALDGTGVKVFCVRFPSPVESPVKENNTVHAEYYRPEGKGPFPAVVVLDITGGDQTLSRVIATHLASNKICGLFVQMAYYGPRRPAGSNLRLMTPDLKKTTEGVRQTVLDVRRASAWLEARPEVDAKQIGVMGTSLGSFVATLSAEMEPRFCRLAVLLGGGGLVDGYWDHPKAVPYRKIYELLGGTKDKVKALFAPIDPITCAGNLKDRQVLIVAGKRDDIVPPQCAEALWQACGKQKIIWYDCTHYGAIVYIIPGLNNVVKHFRPE